MASGVSLEQRAEQTISLHAEMLAASTRPERRSEINSQLEAIRASDDWQLACFLVERAADLASQFFGASMLYEITKNHCACLLESPEVTDSLRKFLFTVLSQGANSRSQSVINKLSSAMAMFALNCIPDIWDNSIYDMTCAWSSEPELLLRVLAEMPLEFYNLKVQLAQRSAIRSVLQRSSESIIRIIHTVFSQAESSPSLSNAAVECVESWMKLPNISVLEWKPILIPIFTSNSQDGATVARLLTILYTNEELGRMDRFVLEVAECIACSIIPDSSGDPLVNLEDELEHITSLIAAISGFSEIYVYTLCSHAFQNPADTENKTLCTFFLTISSFPGQYPVEECFSEIPDSFWSELRTAVTSLLNEGSNPLLKDFRKTCESQYYAAFARLLVSKLAFSRGMEARFSKEEMEKWKLYRNMRLEPARIAFLFFERSTIQILLSVLQEAASNRDLFQAESVFHVTQFIGDIISESNIHFVIEMINIATTTDFLSGFDECDVHLYLASFLSLLQNTASCIVGCAEDGRQDRAHLCVEIYKVCVGVALRYLSVPKLTEKCLSTLERYVEGRTNLNAMVAEEVLNVCFAYFSDEGNASANRIACLRCIGCCLSVKSYDEVISALRMIISDKQKLDALGDGTFSSENPESTEKQFLFELDVYTNLLGSIRMTSSEGENPCTLLLETYVPTFTKLVNRYSSNAKLMQSVTAALKAGLNVLDPTSEKFFVIYSDVIEQILLLQPYSASPLAQSFLLTFAGNQSAHPVLLGKVADWMAAIQADWEHTQTLSPEERSWKEDDQEELLKFVAGIIRKHWNIVVEHLKQHNSPDVGRFLDSLVAYLCDHVSRSCNSEVVKRSVGIFQFMLNKKEPVMNEVLANKGELIVATLFVRLQSDLLSSIVNLITDVLQFFYANYSQETRAVISRQPNSDNPEVVKALSVNPANKREFLVLLRNFHKRIASPAA
uniref:Xpo1 domain-containing protein n=1 Tax=Steinernema glaseri TaxID=37863 RepID=A0A1I8A2Y3_9BILA